MDRVCLQLGRVSALYGCRPCVDAVGGFRVWAELTGASWSKFGMVLVA